MCVRENVVCVCVRKREGEREGGFKGWICFACGNTKGAYVYVRVCGIVCMWLCVW